MPARIGIDAAFTIHDREDSADLMNLARHELGFSDKGKRFPLKGTCLAIYSAAVNRQDTICREILQTHFLRGAPNGKPNSRRSS